MTQKQFLRILATEVGKSETRWRAAERLELSESTLSRVLSGKQQPSALLLARFGLMATVIYTPLPRNSNTVKAATDDM